MGRRAGQRSARRDRAGRIALGRPAAIAAMAAGFAAHAEPPAAAPGSEPSVAEVVGTGTRLARTDAASANPITVVTPEALVVTNTLTVDDILAEVSAVKSNAQTPTGTGPGASGIERTARSRRSTAACSRPAG